MWHLSQILITAYLNAVGLRALFSAKDEQIMIWFTKYQVSYILFGVWNLLFTL